MNNPVSCLYRQQLDILKQSILMLLLVKDITGPFKEGITLLRLQTDLEGKTAFFGDIQDHLKQLGYDLGGNWDYDKGCFDSILSSKEGETIYLRVPFLVLNGELDEYDASIKFQTPYVIKHEVNIGLDKDEHSLASATGFNQFQDPINKDGQIEQKSKWENAGEEAVKQIVRYLPQ